MHLSYRTVQTNFGRWHRGIQRYTEKPHLTLDLTHILMEKRNHARMNRNTMATLESLDIGAIQNNRMLNCSDDGLYFESHQLLLPGTEVFIRIDNFLHSQTGAYRCHHVKIKWGKRIKNSPYFYGYGAKYVEPHDEKKSLETDSDQIIELRKHQRKYYSKPATFRSENKSYEGFISNLSRNGCFIENLEFLNIGQILELTIPGTRFSENKKLKVEVARLSPIGVGVKFKSIIKKDSKK